MTPNEVQQIAERAYAIFLAREPNAPPWNKILNQHEWRDLVQSKRCKAGPANPMEAAVYQALDEFADGAAPVPAPAPAPAPEPEAPIRKTTIISKLIPTLSEEGE